VNRQRVRVVTCSPRVAAGQLTVAAWDALREGPVLTGDVDHPQLGALAEAGIEVEIAAAAAVLPSGDFVWLGDGPPAGLTADAVTELIVGSRDVPGAQLIDAVAVMDRLRSPGGCPWDAEQTHTSLAPYLLEEAYEAYQALEDGAFDTDLREELGDVLLQVLFHARLAQEPGGAGWDIDDVAADLVAKLVRRHPHVFGDTTVDGSAAVEANWDAIKAVEKQRTSVTDGVALAQPALSLAAKLVGRAAKAGLPTALPDAETGASADELLGRALFGLVARARAKGQDPEAALRTVTRRYAETLREEEARHAPTPD
jgi:XTP/dITP diphosphohydrolase